MSKETKPYSYFDTPDGEDIVDKLIAVLKPTAVASVGLSTVDVLFWRPKGYMKTLGRYAFHAIPLLGISSAFVLTTNLVCNIRKEDDKLNWVAGGLAAGGVFGVWWGTTLGGVSAALAFAAMGFGKKLAIETGYRLTPSEIRPRYGGALSGIRDGTLIQDIPGVWKVPKP